MKVGIAGFGVIGKRAGRALDDGIDGLTLEAVSSRNAQKAASGMSGFQNPVDVVSPKELARRCDVIVECAPTAAFREIAVPALEAGKLLITVSGGALLGNPDIIDVAKKNGGRIILATGALLGLDAVRAAAEGEIYSVIMITRKPPKSLKGAPYLKEHNIDIENLGEALQVFQGTAREGAVGFPANLNVAAALALAGVGADKTHLEIWADPDLGRNTHTISVDADSARFELTIENIPSEEKPGTGKITALSVIATLRGLVSPLRVGT